MLARRRFAVGATLLVAAGGRRGRGALVQPAAGPLDAVPALVTAAGRARCPGLPGPRWRITRAEARRRPTPRPRAAASCSAPASSLVSPSCSPAPGSAIVRTRNKISDIVLPKAAPAAPGAGGRPRGEVRRHQLVRHPARGLLPGRHQPDRPRRRRRLLDAHHRRRRRRRRSRFTFDELTRMDVVEHDITLTCVSNEVGGNLVGAARWLGVPLQGRARPGRRRQHKADQILSTAVDGFTISTPLEVALDGRNSMLAFGMNGEPLPREHGFPVRLVTPGLYGFVGSTKWLEKLTLTTYDAARGLLDQAQVGHRRTDQALQPGRHPPAPVHHRRRPDRHRRCRLGPARRRGQGRGPARRRRLAGGQARPERAAWSTGASGTCPGRPTSGSHQIAVRATNRTGETQTTDRATPFPDGSSGVQEVVVTVALKSFRDPHQSARPPAPNPLVQRTEAPLRHRTTKGITMKARPSSAPASRPSRSPCRWAWLPAVPTTPGELLELGPQGGDHDREQPAQPRAASSAPAARPSRRRVTAPSRACPPLRSPRPPAPTRC